jgi:hypothetical protein
MDGMHDDIGVRLEEGRYHLQRADGNKCDVETQDRPLTSMTITLLKSFVSGGPQ